jgi:hypothetical protein
MANSPPFVASNSFVETPLRRRSFQTGLLGKGRVVLTVEDIIDFMSDNERKKTRDTLVFDLKLKFYDSFQFGCLVYGGAERPTFSGKAGMRSQLF